MRGVKTAAILVGILMVFSGIAFAGGDSDCNQGASCKLSEATPNQFATMTYPDGQAPFKSYNDGNRSVDGVAVRRDGDKLIDVMFATKLACSKTVLRSWDVAICGAEEVTHRMFEGEAGWADKEILNPKGKFGGCSVYELKTTCAYDAMHAKVAHNQLKIHVLMDGKGEGYEMFVADQHIPARDSWYHFIVK